MRHRVIALAAAVRVAEIVEDDEDVRAVRVLRPIPVGLRVVVDGRVDHHARRRRPRRRRLGDPVDVDLRFARRDEERVGESGLGGLSLGLVHPVAACMDAVGLDAAAAASSSRRFC